MTPMDSENTLTGLSFLGSVAQDDNIVKTFESL